MRLFTRVVDRRSFTQAAHDLDIPRSTATQVIQQMEDRLGVRLLQRTTRTVMPTLDGEAYYRRCLAILDDIEDADGAFSGAVPKGTLRVEVQGTIARHFLMPGLPQFFVNYPDIEIAMSESDRWVDVVREGVDCVLRYGALPDSDFVARTVTSLERITCAAPAYLERYGCPQTPDDLASHRAVGLRSLTSGALAPFEFVQGQGLVRTDVAAPLSVTGTESYLDGVRLGLGLAQMPVFILSATSPKAACCGYCRSIRCRPGQSPCCIRAAVNSHRACGCSSTGSCSGFRPRSEAKDGEGQGRSSSRYPFLAELNSR